MLLVRTVANSPPLFAVVFSVGMLFGAFVQNAISKQWAVLYGEEPRVMNVGALEAVGLSHNPEIQKRVLVDYFGMPHITQIAKSSLKAGQVASENKHRDMVELFIFTAGKGIVRLDERNVSVGPDYAVVIYPPTKHTIFNTGSEPLELFTVASVP